MYPSIEDQYRNAQLRFITTVEALRSIENAFKIKLDIETNESISKLELPEITTITPIQNYQDEIYQALLPISVSLANSYLQICTDLANVNRHSWAGTAHEMRQLISTLLLTLAPDEKVASQPNFKPENQGKPSQKQRISFILSQHDTDSSAKELIEKFGKFEEIIAEMIREFYGRASDAAHKFKEQKEAMRIFKYFRPFLTDLLNL